MAFLGQESIHEQLAQMPYRRIDEIIGGVFSDPA